MSKYTTELRFICEYYAGLKDSAGFDEIDDIISKSGSTILGEYPIFDETYRNVLNSKIIKHYYTREICEETVGLWKLRIQSKLNEIMPFYNKLYKSELLKFNPFYEVDLTTTRLRSEDEISEENNNKDSTNDITQNSSTKTDNNSSGINNVKNSSKNDVGVISNDKLIDKVNDTPQGAVELVDLFGNEYLTRANLKDTNQKRTETENNEENGTSTFVNTNDTNETKENKENIKNTEKEVNKNEVNRTEDYLEKVSGKTAGTSYSKLLIEYRKTFINIDKMIIDELTDLFINIW